MITKSSMAIVSLILSTTAIASIQHYTKQAQPTILSAYSYPMKAESSITPQVTTQRFIVELKDPGIATYKGGTYQLLATASQHNSKINIQSVAAKAYAQFLGTQQIQFSQKLTHAMPNARIEQRFNTLFNGVVVTGQGLSLKRLATMKNVKSVYREHIYKINSDTVTQPIDTQMILTALSGSDVGRGVRIAIIDSGIRPENPMFADDGFTKPTTNMPDDDYCSLVDPNFCNNKLIVARWISPPSMLTLCDGEHKSPLGYISHGSHVAGIAAGDKISAIYNGKHTEISGVAPAAYLMVYKISYSDQTCNSSYSDTGMMMAAIEQAVKDGADIINISLGNSPGGNPDSDQFSPFKKMYKSAEKVGVIVVTAAGNSGNSPKTIACPACIESGIAVANSTSEYFFTNGFSVDGGDKQVAIAAGNDKLKSDVVGKVIAARNIDPDNINGCQAFAYGAFNDSIAIIGANNCLFSDKANNAYNAGAKGLVIYNNNNDGLPVIMGIPNNINLPSVMISGKAGNDILASLDNNTVGTISAQISRIADKNLANIIHYSSSRGPNGNENVLKPDIAAPGTDILSATSPDDSAGKHFGVKTGTSMASPYIAGAAAVMRQLHPRWSANDIKTALTSTAHNRGIRNGDGSSATPFSMGAGIIDITAAKKTLLTFDKPSIAANSCTDSCEFTRTIYNKADDTLSLSLSVTATATGIGMSISPANLELQPGESAQFTVAINVDDSFDDSSPWIFGNIIIDNEYQQAHLPIAVMASKSKKDKKGGALGWFTLLMLPFIVWRRFIPRAQ